MVRTSKEPIPKIPLPLAGTIVYGTTVLLVGLETLVITYGFSVYRQLHPVAIIGTVAIAYMLTASYLVYRKNEIVGNWMTLALYLIVAIGVLLSSGINAPVGLLFLGFFVLLAGTLISFKIIITATLTAMSIIIAIHLIHVLELIKPDISALALPSRPSDVITYVGLFGIFGLVAWVISKHTSQSLERAKNAEARLRLQKDSISLKLNEESRKLKYVQIEEIQQLYSFAHIGQSTVAILHELSNHLSVLAFDIDDLADRPDLRATVKNSRESIAHIRRLITEARQRIQDKQINESFDALKVIKNTVSELTEVITANNILVSQKHATSTPAYIKGDPLSLAHVLTILLNNAKDACMTTPKNKITVTTSKTSGHFKISVSDTGPGIPPAVRQRLFQPQKSTKAGGMGIGLYITKHIINTQFQGKITLDPMQKTQFTITLPLMNGSRKAD